MLTTTVTRLGYALVSINKQDGPGTFGNQYILDFLGWAEDVCPRFGNR